MNKKTFQNIKKVKEGENYPKDLEKNTQITRKERKRK